MLTDEQAADLSQLIQYAMDSYLSNRESLSPAPDPRLSPRWRVLGYLTASDALFRSGQTLVTGDEVCYGYLAQEVANPRVYVAAIRGTANILEWIKDAQFISVPHPVAGRVEQGFWSIYASMTYRPIAGKALPAAQGLAAAVGQGELIVLGHSLGAPLATYLTFDLASELGTRVQTIAYASPRPGDAGFVKAFADRVKFSVVYNYELDVVPRVPIGPDYTDLTTVHWIGIESAQAEICFTLACHHHILSYAAMLNYKLLDWKKVPLIDQSYTCCIKGPSR